MEQMLDQADVAFRAEESFLRAMSAISSPRLWCREGGGALAVVTGVNLPAVNGVWVLEDHVDLEECGRLIDEVAERDVPFTLQARAGQREQLEALACAHEMTFDELEPFMVLWDLDGIAVNAPEQLTLRELTLAEFDVHCRLAADAFEASQEVFTDLMSLVSRYPGVGVLVGEVDGSAVTTALTVPAAGPSVGVFNVATAAMHRGRGYGAAITDYAVRTARQNGAQWAWLQSSPAGYGVYSGLGYQTVARRPVWTRLPSPSH